MSASRPAAARSVSPADIGALLFLGAVWGGAILFLRIASPVVGPAWAAELRIAIAASVLVVVAGRRTLSVLRGRLLAFVIVGATFSALPFTLISFATLTLPTGMAALLNAATPLFTAVLGVVVLRQPLTRGAVAGLAIGLLAVLVLVGWSPLEPGPATLLAAAASLGAAASYAVAGTYVRRRLSDVGGLELATGQVVAGSIVLLPVAVLSGPPGAPTTEAIVALVVAGVVSTALAWPLFFRVLSHTTPTAASTATFLIPAFAIAWGSLALGEPIGPELLVGFGLVLVSLVLVLGVRVRVPRVGAGRAIGARRASLPA